MNVTQATSKGVEILTNTLKYALISSKKDGLSIELQNDNLYTWNVHLFDFPSTSNLLYVFLKS